MTRAEIFFIISPEEGQAVDYHVRGIAQDTGMIVEFNVSACDERHVIEVARAEGIAPEEIELIGEGWQGDRFGVPSPRPAFPDELH